MGPAESTLITGWVKRTNLIRNVSSAFYDPHNLLISYMQV